MNIRTIALMTVLVGSVAACSYVPAGNVGIKVNLLGGDKGVDSEVLGVGRYWIGWNEELYVFPTFMQNYVWTAGVDEGSPNDESISFQTADGMTANADIGISYSIDPEKVSIIFQTYRRGVDEITDTFLRNMVRDALVKQASNKPIEYVYGAGKADLIAAVQKDVSDQVVSLGINIGKIYWIGEIRLPPTVIDSINAKNAATQMAQQRQNEVAQAKAEADKKIEDARGEAESILRVAEAQAKANKLLAESLTTEFVQYQAITKWDGQLPKMTGSSAVPFIDVTGQAAIQ
jgi:regulator of protease activity HflC (stomatin/prohibitin superfamily)